MMYTFKAPGPAHAGPRRANWQQAPPQPRPRLFPFGLVVGEWEGKGRGRRRQGRRPGRCLLGVAAGGLFGIWGLGCGVVRDLVAAADKQAAASHTTTTGGNRNAPPPKMMHGPVPEWGSQPQALGFPNEAGDCRPLTHTRNRSGSSRPHPNLGGRSGRRAPSARFVGR